VIVLIFAANDENSTKGDDVLSGLNNSIQEGLVFVRAVLAAISVSPYRAVGRG
jgi:hypothetical protein